MIKSPQVDAIHLHPSDNIGVATRNLKVGDVISLEAGEITIRDDIPMGHKFALGTVENDQHIYKYGQAIGITRE